MPTWVTCLMTDQTQQASGSVSTVWPSRLNPEETAKWKSLMKTEDLLKTHLVCILRRKLKVQSQSIQSKVTRSKSERLCVAQSVLLDLGRNRLPVVYQTKGHCIELSLWFRNFRYMHRREVYQSSDHYIV